jgi:hypothetical protein
MNKQIFLALFSLLAITSLKAQSNNTWKGGYPGHETDWSFSKNWSKGHVPSEFDAVVIPDVSTSSSDYPVIRSGGFEVASLYVQSGATLTMLPGASLLTADIEVLGTCKGCKILILIEELDTDPTASGQ